MTIDEIKQARDKALTAAEKGEYDAVRCALMLNVYVLEVAYQICRLADLVEREAS